MGLGSLSDLKLSAARQRAAECREQRLEGIDPIEARDTARHKSEVSGITFRRAFETFFATKRNSLSNAQHASQWRSTMETYVFPFVGDRPVGVIEAREILELLTPVWFAKPETARGVLQRMEAVFKSAILRGYCDRVSPCVGVKEELGARRQKGTNHRALDYRRIPAFLTELRNNRCYFTTKLAFEWLVLTATRSREARLARWSEIDVRAQLWTIPAERMKSKRSHLVPLSDRCLEILKEVRASYPSSELIFPGLKPGAALSDMTFTKVLRDMGLGADATPHGMRSAFKVWGAEVAKVRDEVSEAALAHTIPDKVRAAYLRSDFLDERRAVMDAWAKYCRKNGPASGTGGQEVAA